MVCIVFVKLALYGNLSKTRWFLGSALVDGGLNALGLAVDCCGNAVVPEANGPNKQTTRQANLFRMVTQ